MPIEVVAAKVLNSGSPVVLTDINIPKDIKKYFSTYESLNIHIRKGNGRRFPIFIYNI
jgi:hypothetical protein